MLGLGVDTGLLLRSLHGALAAVGRDQTMRACLTPDATTSTTASGAAGRTHRD